MERKIVKSFTINPAAVEQLENISRLTGLDQSAVINGAIEAIWSVFASGGLRAAPSLIEVLGLTGKAGSGFYLEGKREEG
jgi:hypothetical protein